MTIRLAIPADQARLLELRHTLWSEMSAADNVRDVGALLSGNPRGTLPLVVFVAEEQGALLGFIEVGLR